MTGHTRKAFLALLLCCPLGLSAANLACQGKVERYYVYQSNGLYVDSDWNANPQRICDLGKTRTVVRAADADVCAGWLATVQLALTTNRDLRIDFDTTDTTPELTTCAGVPAHSSAPVPKLLQIQR